MPTLFIFNCFWNARNILNIHDIFHLISAEGLLPFTFLQHYNLITVEILHVQAAFINKYKSKCLL